MVSFKTKQVKRVMVSLVVAFNEPNKPSHTLIGRKQQPCPIRQMDVLFLLPGVAFGQLEEAQMELVTE